MNYHNSVTFHLNYFLKKKKEVTYTLKPTLLHMKKMIVQINLRRKLKMKMMRTELDQQATN